MKLIFKTKDQITINRVNDFIKEWNNDSTTITTLTSGSTGTPKSIQLSKKKMIASAKMTGEFLKLEENKNALLSLPISSIGGKMMVVRSVIFNLQLIVVQPSKNPLKDLNEKIHFSAMTPMQVQNCLTQSKTKLETIEHLIIGGASVSSELEKKLQNLPNRIYQTFGMTETLSHVAMKNITAKEQSYHALPNIHFSEENSSLIIHASHLGIQSLRTNDVVELISSKEFIWKGRSDQTINSGGIKIHPEEIEQKLSALISFSFFSTSIEDDELGEKHVLFIESSKDNLYHKDDFSQLLTKYEIPKEIFYIPSFSYTHSGKIDIITTKKRSIDAQKQVL